MSISITVIIRLIYEPKRKLVVIPSLNLYELFPKEIVRDMRDFQHFTQFLKALTFVLGMSSSEKIYSEAGEASEAGKFLLGKISEANKFLKSNEIPASPASVASAVEG